MNNKPDQDEDNRNQTSRKRALYSVFRLLFIFEYINGIYRFYFKDGSAVPPSWKMKLHSTALVATYTAIFSLWGDYGSVLDESLRNVIGKVPLTAALIQYISFITVITFFQNESNIRIFNAFAELDSQLIKTDYQAYYQKSEAKHNTYFICLVLSHCMTTCLDFLANSEDPAIMSKLVINPVFLILKVVLLAFTIHVTMLNSRLSIINGYLAKFIEETNRNKTGIFVCDTKEFLKEEVNMIGRPSEHNTKIRDLANMYGSVGALCSMVNDVYNFQIFATLLNAFAYIVVTIWSSLYYFRKPDENAGPLIAIASWCLTTILFIGGACWVCENLRSTRNITRVLVNQIIMDYDLPKTMRVQAKAFMELIESWPLNILVYDMFSVDINLLLKFINVSTTYLIVIIQVLHFS